MIFKLAAWLTPFFKVREDKKFARLVHPHLRFLPGHTLYHFQLSPYAKQVRTALASLPIKISMKDVLLDDVAYRELTEQGGKDQVPCLKIDAPAGAQWMYESKAIISYLKKASEQ